jgi:ABC-type branched-subunit amino acid transport system substrate-binding protein
MNIVTRLASTAIRTASETSKEKPMTTLMRRGAFVTGTLALLIGVCVPAVSPAEDPIKIGVIGEASSVAGASITKAAQMAADDVNAHGGVNGRQIEVIIYDDHSSAADAVQTRTLARLAHPAGRSTGRR